MPLRCSCGAILPEDARFCHKCGAPQYEEDIARLNAVVEPPPAQPQAVSEQPKQQSRIGFTNGRALRVTLAVAALSLFASALIGSFAPPLILFPIVLAAGFTSVRVYLSLTAEKIKVSGGAILGAMTGLWLYLPAALSAGFNFLFTAQGKDALLKALKNAQTAALVDDPAKLAPILTPVLIVALILIVTIGAASGALGGILAVRWQPRNGPSH